LQINHDGYWTLARIDGDDFHVSMCAWCEWADPVHTISAALDVRFRAWKPKANATFRTVSEHTTTKW